MALKIHARWLNRPGFRRHLFALKHGFNNQLSPVEFEKHYAMSLQGVWRIRGDSRCERSSPSSHCSDKKKTQLPVLAQSPRQWIEW
jgi:hypothetical protein